MRTLSNSELVSVYGGGAGCYVPPVSSCAPKASKGKSSSGKGTKGKSSKGKKSKGKGGC